jgi:hypothetical protein
MAVHAHTHMSMPMYVLYGTVHAYTRMRASLAHSSPCHVTRLPSEGVGPYAIGKRRERAPRTEQGGRTRAMGVCDSTRQVNMATCSMRLRSLSMFHAAVLHVSDNRNRSKIASALLDIPCTLLVLGQRLEAGLRKPIFLSDLGLCHHRLVGCRRGPWPTPRSRS